MHPAGGSKRPGITGGVTGQGAAGWTGFVLLGTQTELSFRSSDDDLDMDSIISLIPLVQISLTGTFEFPAFVLLFQYF